MQEDIASLKKGQAPIGFQIEKQSENETSQAPRTPVTKPVAESPTAYSHVELGKLEKSKPMAKTTAPGLQLPKVFDYRAENPKAIGENIIKPPAVGGFLERIKGPNFKKIVVYVIIGGVGFVVTAFLIPYFVSSPTATPTPTLTVTRTPTPIATPTIEGNFKIYSSVNIDVGPSVFEDLLLLVNQEVLANGDPGLYKIVNLQTGQNYSFNSFISSTLVTMPEEIKPFINQSAVYLTLIKKTDGDFGYGFVVKLDSDLSAMQALKRWEANMSTDLEDLFGFDLEEAASVNFLDNVYQGRTIRYRNFPENTKTIDYGVVTTSNGDKYLVFTNSRSHIYSIIDAVR